MKTLERLFVLSCIAGLTGYFFHLGERQALADPAPCEIRSCKDLYAWYTGTYLDSAEKSSTTVDPDSNAIPAIYSTPVMGSTTLVSAGTYNRWWWSTSTATCQQIGGQWPFPQEIIPGGTHAFDSSASKNTCTYP